MNAQAATAGTLGDYTASGVALRTQPTLASTINGRGYPGQLNCQYYWAIGDTVNGSNVWWWNLNVTTGVQGYSARNYLTYFPGYTC